MKSWGRHGRDPWRKLGKTILANPSHRVNKTRVPCRDDTGGSHSWDFREELRFPRLLQPRFKLRQSIDPTRLLTGLGPSRPALTAGWRAPDSTHSIPQDISDKRIIPAAAHDFAKPLLVTRVPSSGRSASRKWIAQPQSPRFDLHLCMMLASTVVDAWHAGLDAVRIGHERACGLALPQEVDNLVTRRALG